MGVTLGSAQALPMAVGAGAARCWYVVFVEKCSYMYSVLLNIYEG